MELRRREFLGASLGAIVWASTPGLARAGVRTGGRIDRSGRVLVTVQLTGGNDGLNSVVPYRDPNYRAARPRLAVKPADVLTIDDETAFHPSLRGFSDLLEAGALGIVNGVGSPVPDRSHFTALRVWHTAQLGADAAASGWLSRALQSNKAFERRGMAALHVGSSGVPQSLLGGTRNVPSLERASDFELLVGLPEATRTRHVRALEQLGEPVETDRDFERRVRARVGSAYEASRRFEAAAAAPNDTEYPGFLALGRRLQLIAQCIRSGLDPLVYSTELDGFDTHGNQNTTHPGLLRHLADSLKVFQDDLRASGDAERVLVLVYSEFGRRVQENGSAGTDHGTAGPVFVLGPAVRAGVHGPRSDLTELIDGDPVPTTDFRRVYSEVLDAWLRIDSSSVLGERYHPVGFLRG